MTSVETYQPEEDTGALGPPVSAKDLHRLMPELESRTPEQADYDEERLAHELSRAEPIDKEAKRGKIKELIVENAAVSSPQSYYFVRVPGL